MPAISASHSHHDLDAHFAKKSYMEGFQPTQADVTLLGNLKDISSDLHHLARWKNHILSFSKDERAKWPKGSTAEQNGTVDEDDDVDLFGSSDEEETAEKERVKQQRLADYAAKKAKKPGTIAKSNIILDVKPYDDETDMKELETKIRENVKKDGLVWGPAKLVPVAYGIKKLQIGCVVEDEKVGTDFLEDSIMEFDDVVQSVDIAAFNKI